MQTNFENLTIGAFAKVAAVNVETIRFYQREGLLLSRSHVVPVSDIGDDDPSCRFDSVYSSSERLK